MEDNIDLFIKIFNSTNRKIFRLFSIDFDLDCYINKKNIKFMGFKNYNRAATRGVTSMNVYGDYSKRTYSYIGYLIAIYNFKNINLLNKLNPNDYMYDKNAQILYILVSDEMNFNFLLNKDRFLPDLGKPFEADYFLNKKANFYKKLSDFIKEFTVD